ncbi:hypothetical protein LIER_20149 [Lithospermum erythrorhizon]|uniref:Uncharacterized protein n=1 Tax=Lithospermum erythrorhizon TaxID=34254 RepID=A0AAV3QLD3_LITER
MKGVKDEDKQFDPLFPRINISEAERGGPRAPPTNKMAHCELLTIPSSPTMTNGSMSMMPLSRPSTRTRITASSPPSHVDWHRKSLFSPFGGRNQVGVSPGYHESSLRHPSHTSDGVNNSTLMPPDFRSLVSMSYQSEVHWPPTSKYSMLQPLCFSNSRNLTVEGNREHVNNARLSSFAPLDRSSRKNMEKHDQPLSCTSSSVKLHTTVKKQPNLTSLGELKAVNAEWGCDLSQISEPHMETISSAQLSNENMCLDKLDTKLDTNSISHVLVNDKSDKLDTSAFMPDHAQKHEEVNGIVSQLQENHLNGPAYLLSTNRKTLPDAASGLLPGNESGKPKALSVLSISQKSDSLLDDEIRLHDYKSLQENKTTKYCVPVSSEISIRKRSASVMEGPSRSMEELEYKHTSSTNPTSMDKCHTDKDYGSEPGGPSNINNAMSDVSVEKSIPNYVVSPKDVVRAIGQERFWKARRTILHQQRILAAQLFDLHRLVKVQRMMAESPEMPFEGNFYIRKSSIKLSHSRELFPDTNEEAKAILQESNFKIKNEPEKASRKPLPLNTDKGLFTQQPIPIPCPGVLVVPPITTVTKSSLLLFHPPPGNQWLVPVRSPSEGVVYKPYTGPVPRTGGILSPVHDNIAPISLTGMGDQTFFNRAYSFPASNIQGLGNLSGHSALGHSNPQPYPMPAINAIECNQHLEGSKKNDSHDSKSSCPLENNTVATLSLFPTTPSHQPPFSSSASAQKIQVTKVVPRTRKLAFESAARIFQTIQEERKQLG